MVYSHYLWEEFIICCLMQREMKKYLVFIRFKCKTTSVPISCDHMWNYYCFDWCSHISNAEMVLAHHIRITLIYQESSPNQGPIVQNYTHKQFGASRPWLFDIMACLSCFTWALCTRKALNRVRYWPLCAAIIAQAAHMKSLVLESGAWQTLGSLRPSA